MEIDKIYNIDCLVGMQQIPDKSVDAIICDLPYGTTRNKWDSVIPLKSLWGGYRRIIKPHGAIVLFAQQPFTSILGYSNFEWLRYNWVWEKENGTGFLNANRAPLKYHEDILVFSSGQTTYNPQKTQGKPYICKNGKHSSNYGRQKRIITNNKGWRYPKSILHFARDKNKLHPTQKPVALLQYLIRTYTNEGELVLDNCMGSGTTAIAAMREHRHFIGFETDKKFFEIAENRIAKERQELKE